MLPSQPENLVEGLFQAHPFHFLQGGGAREDGREKLVLQMRAEELGNLLQLGVDSIVLLQVRWLPKQPALIREKGMAARHRRIL